MEIRFIFLKKKTFNIDFSFIHQNIVRQFGKRAHSKLPLKLDFTTYIRTHHINLKQHNVLSSV